MRRRPLGQLRLEFRQRDVHQGVREREKRFISAFELDALTAGATKEGLDLHSQTVQAVTAELVTRRKQFKKVKLLLRMHLDHAQLEAVNDRLAQAREEVLAEADRTLEEDSLQCDIELSQDATRWIAERNRQLALHDVL